MDYILKVLNEESSEWEPIEAIKGADGEQGPIGPVGPQGEPGTTEWTGIDNKPFESIGEGLSVDSEGVLSADGGELKIFDFKNQYTPEEVAEMKPGTAIYKSGTLYYFIEDYNEITHTPAIRYGCPHTLSYNSGHSGKISNDQILVNTETGNAGLDTSQVLTVPEYNRSTDAGKLLAVNSSGDGVEWAEPQESLPEYTSSDIGKVLTVVETSEGEEVQWDEASTPLTFTNGLTESSGTVSWDLNDRIFKGTKNGSIKLSDANNQATGVYSTAVGLGSTNVNGGIKATAAGAFAGGSTNTGEWDTPTTSSNNPSYVRATGVGSFAYGAVGGNNDVIEATGRGAIAIGFVPADGSANKKIQATGNGAFAHGTINVLASGTGSHAEGRNTTSAGAYSFAGGFGAYAGSDNQYVIGKFNKKDTSSKYAFIIGNGTSDTSSNRKNALTVDWDGNIVCNNIPAPPSTDGTYTLQCTVTSGVPTYSWV